MDGRTRIGNFRPYVKKMMPSVYDETLTYYELLTKVIGYLNQTIDQADDLYDYTENENLDRQAEIKRLNKEFHEVERWLRQEALPDSVSDSLNEMLASGILADVINHDVFNRKAEIIVSEHEPLQTGENMFWYHDVGESSLNKQDIQINTNVYVSDESPKEDVYNVWFNY